MLWWPRKLYNFDIMTLQELELLIKQGEGYSLEFKQSLPSNLFLGFFSEWISLKKLAPVLPE